MQRVPQEVGAFHADRELPHPPLHRIVHGVHALPAPPQRSRRPGSGSNAIHTCARLPCPLGSNRSTALTRYPFHPPSQSIHSYVDNSSLLSQPLMSSNNTKIEQDLPLSRLPAHPANPGRTENKGPPPYFASPSFLRELLGDGEFERIVLGTEQDGDECQGREHKARERK